MALPDLERRSAIGAIWRHRWEWLPPFAALAAVMLLGWIAFAAIPLDISLARLFWRIGAGGQSVHGSVVRAAGAIHGIVPILVWLLGGGAVVIFAQSFFAAGLRPWRMQALCVILTLATGPWLLVNELLKEEWHRSRPKHTVELGGIHEYRKPFQWPTVDTGDSFPCGDSSVGYALAVFYLIFRKARRRAAVLMLAGSIALGTLIGVARMLLGAHFASDVFWSGCLVFLVALVLYYFVLNIPDRGAPREPLADRAFADPLAAGSPSVP